MQRSYYDGESGNMSVVNHSQHNSNPDYWDILLSPLSEGSWKNKHEKWIYISAVK